MLYSCTHMDCQQWAPKGTYLLGSASISRVTRAGGLDPWTPLPGFHILTIRAAGQSFLFNRRLINLPKIKSWENEVLPKETTPKNPQLIAI